MVRARDVHEWDTALSVGPGVTAFHRWDWLRGQSERHGWRFEPLLVCHGAAVIGAIPLLLRRRGPAWISAAAPFLYAGPVVADGHLVAALTALRHWSSLHRVLVTRLDFAPVDRVGLTRLLSEAECTWETGDTYVLDISGGLRGFWAGAHRDARKSVRKAERRGVRTGPAQETDVVELLPTLLAEAFASRSLVSPYPADVGRWTWDHLQGDRAIMRAAYVGDRPAGVLIAIGEGRTLYLWAGGALRELRHLRVNHALHCDLFTEAIAQGYQRVDLVGKVDAGVGQFKTSFGADTVAFTTARQTTFGWYGRLRALRERRARPLAPTASDTLRDGF